MKLATKLSLLLGLMLLGGPIYADQQNINLAIDNNIDYEILFGEDNNAVNFIISSDGELRKELLKLNTITVLNNSNETTKNEIDSNNLVEIENGYMLSIPVGHYQDGTKVDITLNAQYISQRNSITKTAVVKNKSKDYLVVDYTNLSINTFNEVALRFKWKLANISYKHFDNLDITATFDGIPLTIAKTGNDIIGTIPLAKIDQETIRKIERVSEEELKETKTNKKKQDKNKEEEKPLHILRLEIGNTENGYVLEREVDLYYEEKLLTFKLNKKYLEIPFGTGNAFHVLKHPLNYDCTLTYESSNPEVVEVFDTGVVIGHELGSSTITARCDDKVAKAYVVVHDKPITVKFNKEKKFLEVGKEKLVDLVASPKTAVIDYESLYLRTSDFMVLGINKQTGMMKAYNEGTAEITYWFDHKEVTETYQVVPAVKEIQSTLERWQRLQVGDELIYQVQTLPFDISEWARINVISSDENILVADKQKIYAVGVGTATITFEYDGITSSAEFEILESEENRSDFSISRAVRELKVGESYDLRNTFIDMNKGTTFDDLTIWTSDKNIYIIDGILYATEPGESLVKFSSQTTTQYFRIVITE